jgi:hypothetical protein
MRQRGPPSALAEIIHVNKSDYITWYGIVGHLLHGMTLHFILYITVLMKVVIPGTFYELSN